MSDRDGPNPYAPPKTDAEAPPGELASASGAFSRPLFSPGQALAATFFGTLVAGVILMQANYRAMGRSAAANKALWLGLLASFAIIAGLMLLPKGSPSLPINILLAYGFRKLVNSLQGDSISTHLEAGGVRRSNWVVFGIILATVAAFFIVVLAIMHFSGALDRLE